MLQRISTAFRLPATWQRQKYEKFQGHEKMAWEILNIKKDREFHDFAFGCGRFICPF